MTKKRITRLLVCVALCVGMTLAMCFTAVADSVEVSGEDILPEMTKQERLEKTVYLQNLNYAAACDGVLTVINPNDKTVTPVFNEGMFYIPLRFVLEYYGVGVSWEHETKTVVMTAGE